MRCNRILALAILICGISGMSFANQEGTSTAQFLRFAPSARAEGMGGAFTAVANDAFAPQYNPAGLAQVTRRQLAVNHLDFIEEINTQHAAFTLPVNRFAGTLGVNFSLFDFGKIERLDVNNVSAGGETDVSAMVGSLSWGQAFGNIFALGATGKFFTEDLAGEEESGFAGDAGILVYAIPNRLGIGVSVLNIGPQVKIGTKNEDLPLTARGGFAYHILPEEWVFSADVEKERDTDAALRLGTEYKYRKRFVIRGGWRENQEASGGLTGGLGFVWVPGQFGQSDFFGREDSAVDSDSNIEIRLDYGFVDYGDFDSTHRFSIIVGF